MTEAQALNPPPAIMVRHDKPLDPRCFDDHGEADPPQVMSCSEVFKNNVTFFCPNCRCVIYNSLDYMKMPAWCREEHPVDICL